MFYLWVMLKSYVLLKAHFKDSLINKYSLRFKMSVALVKKNCFKMSVVLHFQYNFNFFLLTLPSINTQTFLSHNFRCNFNFVCFLYILVKLLSLMIISLNFLICVQLDKATLFLSKIIFWKQIFDLRFLNMCIYSTC